MQLELSFDIVVHAVEFFVQPSADLFAGKRNETRAVRTWG